MKKITLLSAAFGLVLLVSCHFGRRHSIIISNDGNEKIRIEYYGQFSFNNARTAVSSMSPGGYISYEWNDEKLEVQRNRVGQIVYKINGGRKKTVLDRNDKLFVAVAVKEMIKKGHYSDRRLKCFLCASRKAGKNELAGPNVCPVRDKSFAEKHTTTKIVPSGQYLWKRKEFTPIRQITIRINSCHSCLFSS